MPIATVLLVADDLADQLPMPGTFARQGLTELPPADSVTVGLRLAREHYPDVILLDAGLLELEVAPFAGPPAPGKHPPVVILLRDRLRPVPPGGDGVINLPLDPEALAAKVVALAEQTWFARKMSDLDHLGGPPFIVEIIDTFVTQAAQGLARLRTGVDADDVKAVAGAAHSLKSSAANLGAERVRDAAGALEAEANRGASAAVLLQSLHALQEAFDRCRPILQQYRDQAATASPRGA